MSATILDRIKAYKLDEIAARQAETDATQMRRRAEAAPRPRGFADALSQSVVHGYGLIAEVKKASPSKGLIRAAFDPADLARAYETGGATCLSVLTDGPSFQGSEADMVAAREAVSLPVLRKDFLFDTWQVYESRALGADCILIIMAAVEDALATDLEAVAMDLGMDVLIEVHDAVELDRAGRLASPLIGINNRDLHTFRTSLDTTRTLAKRVPQDRSIVAESGLNTPDDLRDLARYGVRRFLIGESLMRQEDVAAATTALLRAPLTSGGH